MRFYDIVPLSDTNISIGDRNKTFIHRQRVAFSKHQNQITAVNGKFIDAATSVFLGIPAVLYLTAITIFT